MVSFKCSEVKVIRFSKNTTQVKNRYSESVLKYSTYVNILHYCPPLIREMLLYHIHIPDHKQLVSYKTKQDSNCYR